jgi:ATP-dependent protease ClpP protease subunit
MAATQPPPSPAPHPPPAIAYVSFSAEINQTTTEGLLAAVGELTMKGVKTIYLLLSTSGGDVRNGMNIYNILRALPVKVITHNVGNVDSIGNVVFLAGEERYSTKHSTFMFHGVAFNLTGPVSLDEKALRERIGVVTAEHKRIADIVADRTAGKLQAKEVEKWFAEATTRNSDEAKLNGIIHDIREAQVPPGAPFYQLAFKR